MCDKPNAIGIDLGTTNSCVAIYKDGRVYILTNEHGLRTTASVVAFTSTAILGGDEAKYQMEQNPSNTIFESKRLMGRNFIEKNVQLDMLQWPFKVVSKDGKAAIEVTHKNEVKTLLPEEIAAIILSKMQTIAQKWIGMPVTEAVVTVPAYFNDCQRKATMDAGTLAGLKIIKIISEPTAAAIAYGISRKGMKKNVLVYDLGGGTLDVSILLIENNSFQVKSTSGNCHLGGKDFDNILMEDLIEEFRRLHRLNIRNCPIAMKRLLVACEQAKRQLSFLDSTSIHISCLMKQKNFVTNITRNRFNAICEKLFISAMEPVDDALDEAKLSAMDIDEVILVGGSSRIPKIHELLLKKFEGKPLNEAINPDEAIAYGAAIQAAFLSGDKSPQLEGMVVRDVVPLSLGTDVEGGLMNRIIKRNTPIPATKFHPYTNAVDNQKKLHIGIYQGERVFTEENIYLGEFNIEIPPSRREEAEVWVTMHLDENGILTVTAKEESSGNEESLIINSEKSNLSQEDIEKMLKEAERLKEEELMEKDRIIARNSVQDYALTILRNIKEKKLAIKQKKGIESEIDRILQWINLHPDADVLQLHERRRQLDFVRNTLHTLDISAIIEDTE